MPEYLVIVESPAKAKTIVKILGPNFKVKASMGHIRDLPKNELGINVENNFEPKYVLMATRKKIISELKQIAKKADRVYLAPDPDREGEAIAWHLEKALSLTEDKIYRVSFNEITKQAVQAAFDHPRKVDMQRVNSQQTRRILDRIVGYKISPLLWKKVGKGLSAGRVQSVALRLICEREQEIRAFVPKEYWSITAFLQQTTDMAPIFTAKLDKYKNEKLEIETEAQTRKILEDLNGVSYVVGEIKKTNKIQRPQPPFKTSLLQQASVNKLKFSVQKTMLLAQQLYEGIELGEEGMVGLITYMRTDSANVSVVAQEEVRNYIANQYGKDYIPAKPNIYKSKKSAQEGHEAIRPTYMKYTPENVKEYLNADQFKLYNLIWERFLSSQMAPAQLKVTSVQINANDYQFKTSGTEVVFKGCLIFDEQRKQEKIQNDISEINPEDEESDDQVIRELPAPVLNTGEDLLLQKLAEKQHFTKPPARFTEATLVKALEERDIGRPSTYAPIIQTIIFRDYVIKDRARLFPTELGETVNEILVKSFPDIIDVAFTANMESQLDLIEEGKADWVKILDNFYKPFMETLEHAAQTMKTVKRQPKPIDEYCELCKKQLVERVGRYGKFIACSGYPECKYTRPIDSGVVCPNEGCGGSLVQRKSKKGKTFFGCSNYPECKFTATSLNKLQSNETNENSDPTVSVANENSVKENNLESKDHEIPIPENENPETGIL